MGAVGVVVSVAGVGAVGAVIAGCGVGSVVGTLDEGDISALAPVPPASGTPAPLAGLLGVT